MTFSCTTTQAHCENCGSTDYEDVNLGDDGYTACCNELTADASSCRNHHGESKAFEAAEEALSGTPCECGATDWLGEEITATHVLLRCDSCCSTSVRISLARLAK